MAALNYVYCPGKRQGAHLLWVESEEQLYKKYGVVVAGYRYKCYENNCYAKVTLTDQDNMLCVRNNESHNHASNKDLFKKLSARNKLHSEIRSKKTVPIKEVFNSVMER